MKLIQETELKEAARIVTVANELVRYAALGIIFGSSLGCTTVDSSTVKPELCNASYLLESAKSLEKREHPPILSRDSQGKVRFVRLGKGVSLPGAPSSSALIDFSTNQAWLQRSEYGGGISWYGPMPVTPNHFVGCESTHF